MVKNDLASNGSAAPANAADGLRVRLDGSLPLAELTALLNGLCDRAQECGPPAIAVLTLAVTRPEDRSWPGRVAIRDVNRWEKAVHRLEKQDNVTIAVAPGMCGGPALDVLLATDYRIATAQTRILLPVNDGQFWPGMALHRLVHQVGIARARQLVMWGHELSLAQALDLGLVDECADNADAAVAAAMVLLGRIAQSDLAVRRRLLLEAPQAGFDEALGVHLAACDRELRRLDRAAGLDGDSPAEAIDGD